MWPTALFVVALVALADGERCMRGGVFNEQFNKCYHVFSAPQVYEEAQAVCASIVGRLVSIHNAFEETLVYGSAKSLSNDYWIGLAALDQPGVWEWSDGVASAYTYWEGGSPPPYSDSLRCAAAHFSSGRWYAAGCDAQKKSFVCEVDTKPETPETNCPAGGIFDTYSMRCFYVFNSLLDAISAEQICVDLQGHLPTVNTGYLQELVFEDATSKNLRGDYWIGLFRSGDEFYWMPDNVSLGYYSNWETSFPMLGEGMNSVAVLLTNGKWYNTMSENVQNCVVCQNEPLSVNTSSTGRYSSTRRFTPTPTTASPYDWNYFPYTISYYKVIDLYSQSWTNYEKGCLDEGANLVSIHDAYENDFVLELLRSVGQNSLWIGLFNGFTNGTDHYYSWIDDTSFNYSNWMRGSPMYSNTVLYCARMYFDGSWYTDQCNSPAKLAVCKKSAEY